MVSRAKDTHTANRVVRVEDTLWAEYEQACSDEGVTRSDDLRAHMRRKVAAWKRRLAKQRPAEPAGE